MSDGSKIDWCNATINPLGWGCYGPGGTAEKPNRCSYCYAHRLAQRNLRACPKCRAFEPHIDHWADEWAKVGHWKKPRRIFVQSMGDFFAPSTPTNTILRARDRAFYRPTHTFVWLTRNPYRLIDFSPWPKNCWVGATATDQPSWERAILWLRRVEAPVRFISCEPLLGPIDPVGIEVLDWLIVGRQTGPGAKPWGAQECDLALQLELAARSKGVPVFIKDPLREEYCAAIGLGVQSRGTLTQWPR
jgi:protein gp37